MQVVHRQGQAPELGLLIQQDAWPPIYLDLCVRPWGLRLELSLEMLRPRLCLARLGVTPDSVAPLITDPAPSLGLVDWRLRLRPRSGLSWGSVRQRGDLRFELVSTRLKEIGKDES